MKRVLLILLLCLMLTACHKQVVEPQDIALEKSERYIRSMNEKDLDTQMELLSAFGMQKQEYYDAFLSHVISAKLIDAKVVHEDIIVVIVEVTFELEMDEKFESESIKKGMNRTVRYMTYYKHDDMKLKEILDKLIK